MPRARLDWRQQGKVDAIADFAETVKSAFEKEGIAQVRIDADVASRSTAVLARVVDQDHHMGTARMARSVDTGVVDANLKMFQTENGYVCSSAVFPTSSFQPNAHADLLAIRLGDHLQSVRNP
jgi:choline dehydrogenase-like flavoprotein